MVMVTKRHIRMKLCPMWGRTQLHQLANYTSPTLGTKPPAPSAFWCTTYMGISGKDSIRCLVDWSSFNGFDFSLGLSRTWLELYYSELNYSSWVQWFTPLCAQYCIRLWAWIFQYGVLTAQDHAGQDQCHPVIRNGTCMITAGSQGFISKTSSNQTAGSLILLYGSYKV